MKELHLDIVIFLHDDEDFETHLHCAIPSASEAFRLKQSLFVSHCGNVTGLDPALPMYNTSCGVCSISLTPTAAALTHQGSRSF